MKGFAWVGLGFFILLFCVGLLLTYWFPSDLVRQELETRLSELLQGTVRIHSLSFNLLTGLEVSQLELSKPGHPPLTLEHLAFNYSLLGLLQGTFTINEISIHHADVSLNLPELAKAPPEPALPPSEPPEPPEPAEPGGLPTLPVSIDLETFRIIESNIHVVVSPELTVNLTRLNLKSSASVSSDDGHLKGTLQVEQFALAFQDRHIQLPLVVKIDMAMHLLTQRLVLTQLTVESEQAIRFTLSGSFNEFLTEKAVNLSLAETHFDLGLLMALAKDFVPPEFTTATVRGTLSPVLTLNGVLPDAGFQGTLHADVHGQNVELQLPDLELTLGPTALALNAADVQIRDTLPLRGKVSVTVSTSHLAFQTYGLHNLDFRLKSDYQDPGPFSGNFTISGTTTLPGDLLGTPVKIPFAVALDTTGNHRTQHVQVNHLNIDLNPYGSLQMKGGVTPQPFPKQGMDASIETRLSPKLNALLALVPKDQLQGLVLQKGTEPDTLLLHATGSLHPDFRPERVKATAALKLSSLQAQWDSLGAEGTMHKLSFLLAAGYQEHHGAFEGTVGLSSNLSNLHAAEALSIGTTHVILKSSFQGNLSPDYQPTSLRSQDQLQLTLGNLTYQDPSLTATIPSLKLSSKTKEDVLNHDYLLESLRLTSENILEMVVTGRLKQATQQFEVDVQMPLLHVGNLLPLLSGPLMQGIDEINPKGRASLRFRAAGRIPQETDLQQLRFPLGLQGKLTLRDLEGAVAGYQIQGGNGTMAMAYSPKASPQAQLTTDLRLNRIHLPDTLPLGELSDTALHVSILSHDINEVQIDPIHVKSKGVDLSFKGTVVGLPELLSSTSPRGTQLAKLFADLQTGLSLDLSAFQETLQLMGMQGTGTAQVSLSMLKKEQGNLDATLDIGAQALSFTRDGTELHTLEGGMQVRKSLAWKPDGLMSPPKTRFQPSDRIAQLKAFSRKGQTITIDRLQLGPITVRNLSANLAFEHNALKLQNLAMNLLGGGIGGNVIITAERPLQITAGLDVANLDANQLIHTETKITGESHIAATLGLTTILQEATGAVDLSRLAVNLHITKIGKEAMDRLIVFLDPEGSNPTLSNVRSQLKLANPSRVTVEVARGQLSLTIHFQGRLIPTIRLDRIPIAKMKNIETLTAAIPNWEDLAKLLKVIGAETYSFTPEGEMVFQ